MTTERKTISKLALELIARQLAGVSDDATRWNLCHLMIEPTDGENYNLVATDGHQMSVQKCDRENFVNIGKKLFINADNLKAIKAILKETKKYNLVFELTPALKGEWVISLGNHRVIFVDDLNYVDYKQIIPRDTAYNWEIALDAEILLKLAKSIQDGKKQYGVRLRFRDPNSFVLVSPDNGDNTVTGLLAPRKTEKQSVRWESRIGNIA